jgi:Tfp pilus assembly protein PilO
MGEIRLKKMLVFLTVILLLLLAVGYVYLIQPISVQALDTERNWINKRQIVTALQAKTTKVAETPDSDRIKLEAVRRQVPEQPYIETIIRDLRRLEVVSSTQLKQYNIEVGTTSKVETNTQTSKAAVKDKPSEKASDKISDKTNERTSEKVNTNVIPIQIETSFVGTYDQIYQLFAEMESLDRLIQVDKMSFHLKQGPLVQINAPGEQIICNLSLVAYYSPVLQALLKKNNDIDYTSPNGRINPFN